MKELAAISLEMAQLVVTDDGDSAPPPSWFLLRHDQRQQGRDPFLWNVACDYIINGWLMEMGVGRMPAVGALHDPDLAGLMM